MTWVLLLTVSRSGGTGGCQGVARVLAGESVRVHIPVSIDVPAVNDPGRPVGAVAFFQVCYRQLDPVDFALSSVC